MQLQYYAICLLLSCNSWLGDSLYTKKNLLHIFDSKIHSASENMALDSNLLSQLDPNSDPILHHYDWARPSITYGHFIDPKKFLSLEMVEKFGIDLARRPTGGGIVFHLWDLAFSFLMPANHPRCSTNTLENYAFVNGAVRRVAMHLEEKMEIILSNASLKSPDCTNFCMARPTIYDVVFEGKKVAGSAQRRTKNGYLHQGTISLKLPDLKLVKEVLLSEEVANAIGQVSFVPKIEIDKEKIKELLAESLNYFLTKS